LLRAPEPCEVPIPGLASVQKSQRNYALIEVIKSPPFWAMYAMYVMVGVGGLMVQVQLEPLAKDLNIDNVPVVILGLSLPVLTFALSLEHALSGLTRPFFGLISDHIGRESTMFIAFVLGALAIYGLSSFAHDPLLFVILSGVVFLAWGEIHALFPAMCADLYGSKFATANYGLLHTALGVAVLIVLLANLLPDDSGSWTFVFVIAKALDLGALLTVGTGNRTFIFLIAGALFLGAAVLAMLVLKPLRQRLVARDDRSRRVNAQRIGAWQEELQRRRAAQQRSTVELEVVSSAGDATAVPMQPNDTSSDSEDGTDDQSRASAAGSVMENPGFRAIFFGGAGALVGALAGGLSSIVIASTVSSSCYSDACLMPILPFTAAVGALVGLYVGAQYGRTTAALPAAALSRGSYDQ